MQKLCLISSPSSTCADTAAWIIDSPTWTYFDCCRCAADSGWGARRGPVLEIVAGEFGGS
eukprot:1691889-Rhodomonas_salina.3